MKKGFFFTLDAVLTGFLIIGGIILISQVAFQSETTETISYLSKDLMSAFTEIKVSELESQVVKDMISNGTIETPENSVLEQLGEFWALNMSSEADILSNAVAKELIPDRFGLEIVVDGQRLYYRNNSNEQKNLVNARRMISGVKQGEALKGSTASAYLKQIEGKRTSSFLYFGGFAGQGNITGYIRGVPSDVDPADGDVLELKLEADVEAPFEVWINDAECGNYTPGTANMTPDSWALTGCNSSITSGDNKFEILFPGGVNDAYVGGGFFKVTYLTDEPRSEALDGSKKYWFPGIEGVVNLYDSFFAPGNLTSMKAYLHYKANHSSSNNTFYMTIGNETVYSDQNSTTEQFVWLDDSDLSALNYSFLSLKTVPLRMGFENLSFATEYTGDADVMMVTDVSGSMEWEFDSNWGGTRRNCADPQLNDSSTTRLSVAKCLDKDFADDIVNITGNRAGLVSYESSTHDSETVNPTTNLTTINNTVGQATPETGYSAGGSTCVCCGINSAYDVLTAQINSQTVISNGSTWLYETNNFTGPPTNQSGTEWSHPAYNDSSWNSGPAVLGSNENGVGPTISTDMGNSLVQNALYPDLGDMPADNATVEVDFTSGLSQSGNTFGESGGVNDDGWDSSFGYFGTAGTDVYMNVDPDEDGDQSDNTVASDEEIRMFIGNSWDDDAPSSDETPDSGAVGIEFNITQEMYDTLNSPGGRANVYFDWRIDPNFGGSWWFIYSDGEQGWIKSQFGTAGNMQYLGSDLDENGTDPDGTKEVYWCETSDCPGLEDGSFSADLSPHINGQGWHYLALGAKAQEEDGDSEWDDDWRFYFDNIYIEISNVTDKYYLRKHFNVADKDNAKKGIINLLSDDNGKVFVNGNMVHDGQTQNVPEHWNEGGIPVKGNYINEGDNVVAVELSNSEDAAKFDLEMLAFNDSRSHAMMVMTDGQANVQCPRQGTGDAGEDAVQAACDARENYGISVYSVGFSDASGQETLQGIASCGGGLYKKSDNVQELEEFYSDVAQNIITASRQSQTVKVGGGFSESTLYPDSYIELNYTPSVPQPGPNELSLVSQTDQFNSCSPSIDLPTGVRFLGGEVTSYSGEHWTDLVEANGNQVFNLSKHSPDYTRLGDPYTIRVPANYLQGGQNNFLVRTGDNPMNASGCSDNNSLVYTAAVNLSTPRSQVVEETTGCSWTVEFESGQFQNFTVPGSYSGPNTCNYTSSGFSYDDTDAYDVATFSILSQLDFDDDGRVFVNFQEEDLEVVVTLVDEVPYLWGPAISEVRVWQ